MNQLAQINRVLLFTLLIIVLLYWGAPFLIPFLFGIFFAFLMAPICNLLERIRINRTIASLLCSLGIFIVIGGTLFLFIAQINMFISDMPSIEDKMASLIESSQNKIESVTGLSLGEQDEIFEERSGQLVDSIEPYLAGFFGTFFNTILSFLMVLVYLFLLLLYREKIFKFVMMHFPEDEQKTAGETVTKISKVAFHYLWGRTQVMMILGVMFFITFILFGLPYALMFTIIGAVITIIPYFGPLLSGLLPILFSLVYFDSLQKILFFSIVIIIIQLIESYVFEPLIIGNEVKLNPLVVIIAIVIGGTVWGLAGMILFVPVFAMIKIISLDYFELKSIGFLLGHEEEESEFL